MGVLTDVVMAGLDEAQAVADSVTPTADWPGFTFNGFHHVQLCTLLSLLKTGKPDVEFENYLGLIESVGAPVEEGPLVFTARSEQVAELATVAGLGETEIEALASAWGATEEFASWPEADVLALLRELGDLAESAMLQGKCLLLWQSL